jgi:hypothetical protein
MIAIQGTFDGKNIKPLPSERLPEVNREIPVAIVFLEDGINHEERRKRQLETALRMRAQRDAMEPLGMTVAELLEESRER